MYRGDVDVLVAVVLLLLIGCYRRLPFDLLGSRGHVKKKEKEKKDQSHFQRTQQKPGIISTGRHAVGLARA